MRVLVLAPSLKRLGGIQRYATTLIQALKDLCGKENVRLVSLHLPDGPGGPVARATAENAKLWFGMAALREGLAWRPDLVICAHVGIAPLGRLLRVVGVSPYWVIAYGIDVWGRLRARDHRALVCADRVIAISEFTRVQVVRLQGVRSVQTCLLPPCLDEQWMAEALSYSVVPRQHQRPVMLTVSRLSSSERYKGHDVVLEALHRVLKEVPNAMYVVVGDGDDRPRLEELSCSLGLAGAVRFQGAVTAEALKGWYRDCDVFLMPAQTVLDHSRPQGEGFGIVFLEAMAYGKPVIGPASGAPSEFIHHKQHGLLVDPQASEEVASALIELLNSPERAREMGAAARTWVAGEYSYAGFRERLGQLLESGGNELLGQEQCAS